MFPVDRIQDIIDNPGHFKLIEMIPREFTLPITLDDPCKDDRTIIFLDTETTGLYVDGGAEIIELGLLKARYCPYRHVLTEIVSSLSLLEEPSNEDISPDITQITGITPEMVSGHRIDHHVVYDFLELGAQQPPLLVAHNAWFDRPFIECKFEALRGEYPWACSLKDIDWRTLCFEGGNLTALLMQTGHWLESTHRALSDCWGIAWLMYYAEGALEDLIRTSNMVYKKVWANRAPFRTKDALKTVGYKWNGTVWSKTVKTAEEVDIELARLDRLYKGAHYAKVEDETAFQRYARTELYT